MPLVATLLAGLFFLVGAAVAWRVRDRRVVEGYSVAVAFGSLACVAVFDLLPEAIEFAEGFGDFGVLAAAALAAIGLAALVMLDHAVPDHHAEEGGEGVAHIGAMAVLAVSVHNIAEGAAIFIVTSQDAPAGFALACGVGLHNAPMGMLMYSAMQGGRAKGVAVLAAASLSTFLGGLVMVLLGNAMSEAVMSGVVCVALGMIAYILFGELLPAMRRDGNAGRTVLGIAIGAAFVLVGMLLE